MLSKWMSWIVFVAICFGAAAVGGWFTDSSVKTWYPGLMKPAGTPPSWVFGPVWSVLYLLMATAAWLVWQERHAHDVRLPLGLFFGQLFLNAAWSFIFFGLQRPDLALVEILIRVPRSDWVRVRSAEGEKLTGVRLLGLFRRGNADRAVQSFPRSPAWAQLKLVMHPTAHPFAIRQVGCCGRASEATTLGGRALGASGYFQKK